MNELPPLSESPLPPEQPAGPVSAAASTSGIVPASGASARAVPRQIHVALALLALLILAHWWSTRADMQDLRAETARRLQAADGINSEVREIAKSVQENTKELQAKVSVLENKQIEAQGQQLALEQLYQDLSKSRDDWALAEIEQVLSTASQQLQLAGNVQGALIALQNADSRLSRSDKPQFITIRRAIARDIERLKALPILDVAGIALRLDSVIGQIDAMPLLSDEKPALPATQPKPPRWSGKAADKGVNKTTENKESRADWLVTLDDKWQSWSEEMWGEIRQLIRVRSVDVPDALLLSPMQTYYARENLKLRLLNARLALLTRNESAFRSDMIAAQDAIGKYFDTRSKQTQTAQVLLRQVQSSNLSIEMPTLVDSLNAVHNYKTKP